MLRFTHNSAPRWMLLRSLLAATLALATLPQVNAQSVSNATLRPFVVGIRPVVRNGAVGGVSIDAAGVVSRCQVDELNQLRSEREKALQPVPADLGHPSELRKISLRRLEAAISQLRQKNLPVTDELQNLAGLQRVRYLFVDPAQKDIILAGPAEGWKVGEQGAVVGRTTGQPVLQLDDLVLALRTAEAAGDEPISCSIDPTPAGVQRLHRLSRSLSGRPSEESLRRMENALGPQQITVKGVPADSRFARVMVSADFLMKRLAMGFDASPVDGLPSYLEMLKANTAAAPRDAMPRWWLAPKYEPLLRDAGGLAWELRGPGVQAMTEDTIFQRDGTVRSGRSHPLAKKWADAFTERYAALSKQSPVFAELRNCMDLAVVAALIVKEDLPAKANFAMPLLMNVKAVQVAGWHVPKTVDSRASLLQRGREWIVSVSGGVELNSWAVADKSEERPELAVVRERAMPAEETGWWWWD
jgi:hypothetical protein